MAEAQNKLQKAVDDFMTTLDKSDLRRIQKDAYLCCAKCCDKNELDMVGVQNCITRCQDPVQNVQEFVQNEMNRFQDRVGRCAQQCADQLEDKRSVSKSTLTQEEMRQQMDNCLLKCADDNVPQMHHIMQKTRQMIGSSK